MPSRDSADAEKIPEVLRLKHAVSLSERRVDGHVLLPKAHPCREVRRRDRARAEKGRPSPHRRRPTNQAFTNNRPVAGARTRTLQSRVPGSLMVHRAPNIGSFWHRPVVQHSENSLSSNILSCSPTTTRVERRPWGRAHKKRFGHSSTIVYARSAGRATTVHATYCRLSRTGIDTRALTGPLRSADWQNTPWCRRPEPWCGDWRRPTHLTISTALFPTRFAIAATVGQTG
jgi:hypothetical protein